ncbi:MAG: hypothetical protein ABIR24_00955 [Verrucomicrobiota bacterium]
MSEPNSIYEQMGLCSQIEDHAAFEELLKADVAFRIARDRVYKEFRRRKLLVEPLHETERNP